MNNDRLILNSGNNYNSFRYDKWAYIMQKDKDAIAVSGACIKNERSFSAVEEAILYSFPHGGKTLAPQKVKTENWEAVPHVTQHMSIAVHNLLELRKQLNEKFADSLHITITGLLIKLTATVLKELPEFNAVFCGSKINVMRNINMSVVVACPHGPVAPVIKNIEQKSLVEISKELKSLVIKARENKLGLEDCQGGHITLSNLGVYHSVENFTPTINFPQVAILGIGRIIETPVVEKGQIISRPLISVSLTHDLRALDGATAAHFLAALERFMLNPALVPL